MNFSSKSLIFFLNMLLVNGASPERLVAAASAQITAADVPLKRAFRRKSGPISSAAINVRFIWQTISSQGQGSKMNTAAETFSADGKLIQSGSNRWELEVGKTQAPVTFNPASREAEGSVFIDRGDLLKLLDVDLSAKGIQSESNRFPSSAVTGGVQLLLSRTPSRQMETVYRSPDEELFMVKAALVLLGDNKK